MAQASAASSRRAQAARVAAAPATETASEGLTSSTPASAMSVVQLMPAPIATPVACRCSGISGRQPASCKACEKAGWQGISDGLLWFGRHVVLALCVSACSERGQESHEQLQSGHSTLLESRFVPYL